MPDYGAKTLTPELKKQWQEFYRDVVVLAFPKPNGNRRVADVDEKALYYRAPYSSMPGVKSSLPAPAEWPAWPAAECIPQADVVELPSRMSPDGRLIWDVPPGEWTILRFVRTVHRTSHAPRACTGSRF